MNIKIILKLLRVKHYIKNLFIFAPLFFSFVFIKDDVIKSIIAFFLFSFIASSIYILNDLKDIDYDKLHPKKKFRPIPSGKIKKNEAKLISIFLSLVSLGVAFSFNFSLFIILLTYYLMNLAYTFKLKDFPVIDIIIISTGFVLRLLAGSSVVAIPLSLWIIFITFLLALFLALGKRRDELLLLSTGKKIRKNITFYSLKKIEFTLTIISALIIIAYIIFANSSDTINKFGSDIIYSSIFVIAGFIRYYYLIFIKKYYADPTELLAKDFLLKTIIALWIFSYYFILI